MPGRFQDLSWPSDRDQRRGGDDWRLRDVGHANQRKHPDALQLSDETIQGCGVDPSGGAISQATQNRRKLSCRRCQAAPRCKAAFQLGGLYMTLWYCSRKPDLLDLPAVAAMKWSHSIMREPDFCCECGAREAAQKLAFELKLEGLHHDHAGQCSLSKPRDSKRRNLHVGFAESTTLRLSFDDDWVFMNFACLQCFSQLELHRGVDARRLRR